MKSLLLWTVSIALAVVVVIGVLPKAERVVAASGDLTGAAWSANIGWISMGNEGAGYGVKVATSGTTRNLSGYAWSSNIGWISFDNTTCPSGYTGSCQPRVEWGAAGGPAVLVKGVARACSVYVSGCSGSLKISTILGGWDGFISLGDGNPSDGVKYGVKLNTTTGITSGYGWGSEVVGWVDFNGVKMEGAQTPTCPDGSAPLADGSCQNTTNNIDNCPIGSVCYCTSHPTDTQNCPSGNNTCPGNVSPLSDGSCPVTAGLCSNIPDAVLASQGITTAAQLASGHYVQQPGGRCACQPGYLLSAQLMCVKPTYQEQ